MIFEKIDFKSKIVLKKSPTKTSVKSTLPYINPDINRRRTLVRIKSQIRQSKETNEKSVSPKVLNLNFPAISAFQSNFPQQNSKTCNNPKNHQLTTSRSQQPEPAMKQQERLSPSSQKRKIVYSRLKTSSKSPPNP